MHTDLKDVLRPLLLVLVLLAACDDDVRPPTDDDSAPVPTEAASTQPSELVFVHGLGDVDSVAVSIDGRVPPALAAVEPFAEDPVVVPVPAGKHELSIRDEHRQRIAKAALDCPPGERVIVVAAGFHRADPNKPQRRPASVRAILSRGAESPEPGQALLRVVNAGSDSSPLDVAVGTRDEPQGLLLVNVGFLKGTSWRTIPAGRRFLVAESGLTGSIWLDEAGLETAPDGRHTVLLLGARDSLAHPRRLAMLTPPAPSDGKDSSDDAQKP